MNRSIFFGESAMIIFKISGLNLRDETERVLMRGAENWWAKINRQN